MLRGKPMERKESLRHLRLAKGWRDYARRTGDTASVRDWDEYLEMWHPTDSTRSVREAKT